MKKTLLALLFLGVGSVAFAQTNTPTETPTRTPTNTPTVTPTATPTVASAKYVALHPVAQAVTTPQPGSSNITGTAKAGKLSLSNGAAWTSASGSPTPIPTTGCVAGSFYTDTGANVT